MNLSTFIINNKTFHRYTLNILNVYDLNGLKVIFVMLNNDLNSFSDSFSESESDDSFVNDSIIYFSNLPQAINPLNIVNFQLNNVSINEYDLQIYMVNNEFYCRLKLLGIYDILNDDEYHNTNIFNMNEISYFDDYEGF